LVAIAGSVGGHILQWPREAFHGTATIARPVTASTDVARSPARDFALRSETRDEHAGPAKPIRQSIR